MPKLIRFMVLAAIVAGASWTLVRTARSIEPSVAAQAPAPRPADLVLTNGKIVTVEDAQPEVQAMAVNGDTVTFDSKRKVRLQR